VRSAGDFLSGAIVGFLDRNDVLHASADTAIRGLVGRERLLISAVPVDVNVADMAADLSKSLRMPDALIPATAELRPEVGLILTGDQETTKIRGLTCKVRLLR
jgi:hypothetical protein